MSSPTPSVLIFTSSPHALPVRFSRPHKPILLLPPLIHRALHGSLDTFPPSAHFDPAASTLTLPHPDTLVQHGLPHSTTPNDSELTVKVHLVAPGAPEERAGWVEEAIELLSRRKGLGSVDHLLVGWKGVDYKGKKTAVSEFFGCGAEGLENGMGTEVVPEDVEVELLETWKVLQRLRSQDGEDEQGGDAEKGKVKDLGTLYLPLGTLRRLVEIGLKPSINAMDTPDCHSLPKEYTDFARSEAIELWAGGGGEGSDPLPAADLHNLLQEFTSPLFSLLGKDLSPEHPLSKLVPLRDDMLKYEAEAPRAVAVKWVLGYTVLSKTRNVVKDKGYIVSANLTA